jgi:hypothetical protein
MSQFTQFNQFIQAAKRLIYLNAVSINIITAGESVYNIETGSSTNTEVSTTVKAFPKVVRVSAYNYPNLIGKTVVEFLIVGTDLTSSPKALDRLTRGSESFTVVSVSEHTAGGSVVMYKVLASKG